MLLEHLVDPLAAERARPFYDTRKSFLLYASHDPAIFSQSAQHEGPMHETATTATMPTSSGE